MRFMIIVKGTSDTESSVLPEDALVALMAAYHEALAKAGVRLDGAGLQPGSQGWRIRSKAGKRGVVDAPFIKAVELPAGYTLIPVRVKEDANEWARRFPSSHSEWADGEIALRQPYERDDFGSSQSVERIREREAAPRT